MNTYFKRRLVLLIISLPSVALGTAVSAKELPEVSIHMKAVETAEQKVLRNARSKAELELIKVDLKFSSDARKRHVSEAFVELMASDALLIGPDEPIASGKEEVRRALASSRATWHWSPVDARVGRDLGVTWGVAALVYLNKAGDTASVQTRYVTVWRKIAGKWRIWIDTGSPGPAPDWL